MFYWVMEKYLSMMLNRIRKSVQVSICYLLFNEIVLQKFNSVNSLEIDLENV